MNVHAEAVPSGVTPDQLTVRVFTKESELRALRSSWDALLEKSLEDMPFLTHAWMEAWWLAFSAGRPMYLVTIWRGSELAGIAPLLLDQIGVTRGGSTLRFWSNEYSPRAQIIVGDPPGPVIDVLICHLLRDAPAWDVIRLEPFDSASVVTIALLRGLKRAGVRYGVDDSLRSPFLRLPHDWDELMVRVGASYRQTVRRKRRKAESRFRVRLTSNSEGWKDVLSISEQSWQHGNGTGIGTQPDVRAFYERLCVTAETKGWLQLAFLESEGKAIAYEYNLLYGKKLFNLKLGYRQDVARFSPGLVLKSHVIEDAIRQGLQEYDLLGTDEPYKLHWANDLRQHSEVVIFNRRRQVGLWFYSYCIKPYVRRYLPGLLRIKRWLTSISVTENPSTPR